MQFLSYLISGLGLGSVYAIMALGYSMVYGIAKMLNFAHGDIIMVGAYVAFFAISGAGMPPAVAILLSILACTVLGVVIERLAYKPLREASSLAVLITAIGVSYFLENGALILWGADSKFFPSNIFPQGGLTVGSLTISWLTIITIAVCCIIMILLMLFVGRTNTGRAMRACSEDKGAATLMGINVNAIISLTFAIGSGLAAVAAVLLALDMLKGKKTAYDICVLFAAQEETGERGAKTGTYRLAPDLAIAVDVSFAKTHFESEQDCAKMGEGAMIGIAPVLSGDLSQELVRTAERCNLPYQLEVMSGTTGTDADKISISAGGVRTVILSIPLKYMHTPVEVVDLGDIENTAKLIAEFAQER